MARTWQDITQGLLGHLMLWLGVGDACSLLGMPLPTQSPHQGGEEADSVTKESRLRVCEVADMASDTGLSGPQARGSCHT